MASLIGSDQLHLHRTQLPSFINKHFVFCGGHVNLQVAIDDFLLGYFSTCQRSRKTQDAYTIDLDQCRRHFGSIEVTSITPTCIESLANALRSKGYAPVSIRRKCATLRVFFAYWVRKGHLETSPFWKLRLDLGTQK